MVKLVILSSLAAVLCGVCSVQSQTRQGKTPARNSSANRPTPPSQPRAAKDQPFSVESVNDVLWWLPEDTETVSVVRGPFTAVAPPSDLPRDMSAREQVDLALRTAQLGILQILQEGRFYKHLVGRGILFCVEGSRKFRPPADLGGMLYEGCHIIILEPGLGPTRNALIKDMASRAKQVRRIAGQQVMVFEEKLESDIWPIFIALPASNVLLCATNQNFLTQVIKRMHQRGEKRALPEDLPEWKHVNTGSRFWSVRHYDKNYAKDDPTSPLSGEQSAANWPDTEAIGIVFEFDRGRSRVPTFKYLSANKDALALFTAAHTHPTEEFRPAFRQSAPGEIEMVVSLDDPEVVPIFLLVLFGLFGHATYI